MLFDKRSGIKSSKTRVCLIMKDLWEEFGETASQAGDRLSAEEFAETTTESMNALQKQLELLRVTL